MCFQFKCFLKTVLHFVICRCCDCFFFPPVLLHCPLEVLTKTGCMSSARVSLSYSSKLKCFCCHYQERFNICRCIFCTLLCFLQPKHFFCYAVRFLIHWEVPLFVCKTQLHKCLIQATGRRASQTPESSQLLRADFTGVPAT